MRVLDYTSGLRPLPLTRTRLPDVRGAHQAREREEGARAHHQPAAAAPEGAGEERARRGGARLSVAYAVCSHSSLTDRNSVTRSLHTARSRKALCALDLRCGCRTLSSLEHSTSVCLSLSLVGRAGVFLPRLISMVAPGTEHAKPFVRRAAVGRRTHEQTVSVLLL